MQKVQTTMILETTKNEWLFGIDIFCAYYVLVKVDGFVESKTFFLRIHQKRDGLLSQQALYVKERRGFAGLIQQTINIDHNIETPCSKQVVSMFNTLACAVDIWPDNNIAY